jgi:hypothetical protein
MLAPTLPFNFPLLTTLAAGHLPQSPLHSRIERAEKSVSSALRNNDRSLFISGAGPRVFVPSCLTCLAISRPMSVFPIFAFVNCVTRRAHLRDISGTRPARLKPTGNCVLMNRATFMTCTFLGYCEQLTPGSTRSE